MRAARWVAVCGMAVTAFAQQTGQQNQTGKTDNQTGRPDQTQREQRNQQTDDLNRNQAQNQQNQIDRSQNMDRGQLQRDRVATAGLNTPAQFNDLLQSVKISMADAIRTAEQKANGKCIRAELRQHSHVLGLKVGQEPAQVTGQETQTGRTGQDNQLGRGQDTMGRVAGQQDRPGMTPEKKAVLVITCLSGTNKFVEVIVDSQNGNVIDTRDRQTLSMLGSLEHDSAFRKTLDDARDISDGSNLVDRPGVVAGIQERSAEQRTGSTVTGTAQDRTAPDRTTVVRTGADTQSRWFSHATRWQKATDLVGKNVKNAQGEDLGEIKNLAIDPDTGRILYGVLQFGGFMGLGDKLFAIPWSALSMSPDYKHLILNVDKDRLKNAQGFDQNNWPNMADQRWATDVHTFYNQPPYWEADRQERRD